MVKSEIVVLTDVPDANAAVGWMQQPAGAAGGVLVEREREN
jgi:hypothetical protein